MCVVSVFLALLGGPGLALAQAPTLDQVPTLEIPSIELTAGLSPTSIQQIDALLNYHAKVITDAEGDRKQAYVLAGRDGLIAAYNYYDSIQFKNAVARQAFEIVAPLLDSGDLLKQINVAMALAEMSAASGQENFEKMISHNNNEAVRFLGWRGYSEARMAILATGSAKPTDKMLAAMANAVTQEKSSLVIRVVFEAINFPPSAPEGVNKDKYDRARREALTVLASNWLNQSNQVRYGDWEMSESFRRATSAIANSWDLLSDDPAQRTKYLQMIIDVAWSSAQAYEAAMRVAERATGLTKDDANTKIEANTLLLRSCEQALNSITKGDRDYLAKTLTDTSIPDRASAPRGWKDLATGRQYGVLAWIEELEAEGVTIPKAPEITPADETENGN